MRMSAVTMESELSPSELSDLCALLHASGLAGPHLEIGTAAGGTLKALMQCYPETARPRFVVIDPFRYFDNQQAIVAANLRSGGLDPDNVEFRVGKSRDKLAAAVAQRERFSFIFIDGHHGAGHVMEDLQWAGLLEVGGYVCLHDYGPYFPGVTWATDRFLATNRNYERVRLTESLIMLRKTGPGQSREVSRLSLIMGYALELRNRLLKSLGKRLRPRPA